MTHHPEYRDDVDADLPADPTALPIFHDTKPSAQQPSTHALAGQITPAPPDEQAGNPWFGPAPGGPQQVPDPDIAHTDSVTAASPHAGTQSRSGVPAEQIDWQQVAVLRAQASDQLTQALGDERGVDPETERELGRSIIQELLQSTAADRLHDGEPAWSLEYQEAMAESVFDALFGLGRLQPLVDDDEVENIIITGAENVWVEKTDGSLVRKAPVADSDQELLDFLSFVASRSEANARSFSPANPRLHLRLDGGHRLAAAAWVTAHPSVVIRRHRLREVTLEDLVGTGMLTGIQASLLRAAIRARKSVVVAGPQGAGKTTLVRALCGCAERFEALGTFETEFELHLHELPQQHPIVHAWESRPGSGEIGPDGRPAGEFTLDEALYDSFRFNLSRQIVGEVRGREIWPMIKAMESGTGSISTTHASDGEAAIRKLVTCAMESGPSVTKELATSKLAETVDLVVQVDMQTTPMGPTVAGEEQWRRHRWVSEIVHVAPGEVAKGYATTHVYQPNPAGGPGVAGILPDGLRQLERYGFDLTGYLAENGRQEGEVAS